jgi:hypothetical protein
LTCRSGPAIQLGEQDTKNQNYSISFAVDQYPEQVFNAINNVRVWWSGEIEGETDKLGAEFTYSYQNMYRSKQKITELVPNQKVVWHVLDRSLSFPKDKSEWTGTDIVFDVPAKDGKTEVRFSHVGLAPQIECYGSCSNAWSMLVNGNLRIRQVRRYE